MSLSSNNKCRTQYIIFHHENIKQERKDLLRNIMRTKRNHYYGKGVNIVERNQTKNTNDDSNNDIKLKERITQLEQEVKKKLKEKKVDRYHDLLQHCITGRTEI